jgi:hypothetical protein
MAMPSQRHSRANHEPYIQAVYRSLEARSIRVAGAGVTASRRCARQAELVLRADQDAFAEPVPGQASAFWDEENGWSLLVQHKTIGSRISKGLDVLPDPDDVAAWVVVTLAHPELTPSYERGALRSRSVSDPDFEARLARYPAVS